MRRFLPLCGLLCLLVLPPLRGDEARRRDGTSVTGNLVFDGEVFRFAAEPVGLIDSVRRGKPGPPLRDCGWMLHLIGGDSFPVQPLELTEKELRVRTPWADELRLPRTAVERLGQWPGRQVVVVSGETASVKANLPELRQGWVVVRGPFVKTATRRLTLELGFAREGKPATMSVELAAPEARIGVTAPEPADVTGRLNRDGQSHRLEVAFDADRLQLAIDGYVLWSRERGQGVLREVRLVSSGEGSETVRAEHLAIWRQAEPGKTPPTLRPSRDRLVTTENTELYGVFQRIAAAGPGMDVREKALAPPWETVRELTFADSGGEEKSTSGEHVELTLGSAGQPDGRITGRVRAWNDKRMELEHSRLGLLTIPTALVTEVRPLFHGRRLIVAAGSHHLGTREVAGYRQPKPEGPAVRHVVELDDFPAGELVFEARATRSPTALTVTLDGEKLGTVRVSGDEPAIHRLPVTGRRGRHELEIRLEPDPRPGEAELRGLRLEIPAERPGQKAAAP